MILERTLGSHQLSDESRKWGASVENACSMHETMQWVENGLINVWAEADSVSGEYGELNQSRKKI